MVAFSFYRRHIIFLIVDILLFELLHILDGSLENIEPVRKRHPFDSLNEFLGFTSDLIFESHQSQVNIDIIQSECADRGILLLILRSYHYI